MMVRVLTTMRFDDLSDLLLNAVTTPHIWAFAVAVTAMHNEPTKAWPRTPFQIISRLLRSNFAESGHRLLSLIF